MSANKQKRRTSNVWKVSHDELQKMIDKSYTFKDILKYLAINPDTGSGNYRTLHKRFEEEEFDFTKFEENKKINEELRIMKVKNSLKGKTVPLDQVLVKNSTYSRSQLKKRLIKEGLLEYKCINCDIAEWRGSEITLQLDHINGVHNDNRLENLRLLCPNCHSQTNTFAGRSLKKKYYCVECGQECWKGSTNCLTCHNKNQRKLLRPSLEQLEQEVKELGFVGTGKKYNVSDNTIRKWLNLYKLP